MAKFCNGGGIAKRESRAAEEVSAPRLAPNVKVRVHSSGVNCVAASNTCELPRHADVRNAIFSAPKDVAARRVYLATGGDDQSLCLLKVTVADVQSREGNAGYLRVSTVDRVEGASGSALQAVAFLPSCRNLTTSELDSFSPLETGPLQLVATGWNQRLSRWEWKEGERRLEFIGAAALDVAEVAALDAVPREARHTSKELIGGLAAGDARVGASGDVVGVAGAGMQFVWLEPRSFEGE